MFSPSKKEPNPPAATPSIRGQQSPQTRTEDSITKLRTSLTSSGDAVASDGAGLDDGVLLAGEGARGDAKAGERLRPPAEDDEGDERGGDVERGDEPRGEGQLHDDHAVHGADGEARHHPARRQLVPPRRHAPRAARFAGLGVAVQADGRLRSLLVAPAVPRVRHRQLEARRRRPVVPVLVLPPPPLLLHGGKILAASDSCPWGLSFGCGGGGCW